MDFKTRLIHRSNYWYNDGLRRAKVRDLSGAVTSLKRSLKYNRENVTARNLLGLVYFGCGEIAEALVQWIISKNIRSHENIANYYIKMVQETPSELDNINQAIHKFNQCLAYCQQNGEDLAIIQLKKVINSHPTYVKAYQLLGLLYLQSGEYTSARQVLRKAHRLDNANPLTLAYMHELSQMRKKKTARIKKENKEETVTYNLGNETIIQPAGSEVKEKSGIFTLLNIVIGVIVGAAVIWFLILPAVQQSKAFKDNEEIIAYADEIATLNSEISALKKELDNYRSGNEDDENIQAVAAATQSSYELLMLVSEQYESNMVSNADMVANLLEINPEALGEKGQAVFEELTGEIYPAVLTKQYNNGQSSYNSGSYQDAVDAFAQVVSMDSSYEEGKALLYLANAYALSGDKEKAEDTYSQAIQLFPETDVATKAQEGIDGNVPDIE